MTSYADDCENESMYLYPLSITKGALALLSCPSLIMDWVVHYAELNFLKSRVICYDDGDVGPLPP